MQMKNKDFAIFILTHGRPEKVKTIKTLQKVGYAGKIYIIIDNEDQTADQYYDKFKDQVIMFDKKEIAKTFDQADNFDDRRAIIYARNACFEIAKDLGITYFMQLDDDYVQFEYRFDHENKYSKKSIKNFDQILDHMLEFYKNTNCKSIAMLQAGDMIGGKDGGYSKSIRTFRKAMNTFICSTNRPFQFIGRINEDVNTYTNYQSKGNLFISFNNITMTQIVTQGNTGGMTELYLDSGTYVKSFYTVMISPSSCKIKTMNTRNPRLHHNITWNNAVPKIISQDHRK